MDLKIIEVAALGRPLYPGMLYDCRSDSFIPGVTLWDKNALKQDLDVYRKPKTDLKFSASDALSDNASLMDVSASLKASFLSGLVEVGGSAQYLKDTKSSAQQSRVTLYYSQTTRFEQLTMAELGNIIYPQVFEQETATHVITAVLYGAHAFMVFDHIAADNEDRQEVAGTLNVVVKKIPSFAIEGEGSLKLTENEKRIADNISVTFHGDYALPENPTTYTQALQVYSTLPSLLREKENDAVPVRVWLYPLKCLDDKAATLVREINMSLVSKMEHVLEELGEVERRCNDLWRNKNLNSFPDVKGRVQVFQNLYNDYKIALQKVLLSVLPAVRSGRQDEQVLANILTKYYNSIFTADNLNQWLDNTVSELNIVCCYVRGLKDINIVTSAVELNAILFDPDVNVVVCLSFTSLKYKDKYLNILKDVLDSDVFMTTEYPTSTDIQDSDDFMKSEHPASTDYFSQESQSWFTSSDISKNMRQNLSLFRSFSNGNKNEVGIRFIIASISDPNSPGSSIRLYEKGELKDSKFQPVSRPPPPVVKIQDRTVGLKLQKSPTGETVRFRVEYRMVKAGDTVQDDPWKTRDTSDAQNSFILTDLQLDTQYWVQYRAVGVVGMSEASECVQTNRILPTTDADFNPIILVGGTGGNENIFLSYDAVGMLTIISLSLSPDMVSSVTVALSNSSKRIFGTVKHSRMEEFVFQDGDRFRSLTLWPNNIGNRLGGIEFVVVRKNGQSESFKAQIPALGQPVYVDVGSGVCCGVKVRSGTDIDALGFIFIKKCK